MNWSDRVKCALDVVECEWICGDDGDDLGEVSTNVPVLQVCCRWVRAFATWRRV
jgi:hypothetical protein